VHEAKDMPRRRRERKRFVRDDFATLWRCALTAEYENASTGVDLGEHVTYAGMQNVVGGRRHVLLFARDFQILDGAWC
jgi:hypothetical protein